MSIATLLVAVLVTCVLIWLIQQGHVPPPFTWIVIAVLIVIWLLVLLNLLGIGGLGTIHVGKLLLDNDSVWAYAVKWG